MPKTKAKKSGARKQSVPPETSEPSVPVVAITIVPRKVGENRDNLQRRGKWFGSRSGGKS